ncbi:MAG: sensor histidine kinase [Heteroscytonema crispum UTEX LB 1556]
MDFSQLLIEKTDFISEKWVATVRQDRQIESADELSYTAIQNHLPDVLKAMATVLAEDQCSDIQSIVDASLLHGVLRAKQGFNPAEIAQEYRLLRTVIFETLEADFLKGTQREIIRSMRLIDLVIDEAIAQCFNSYVEERLQELQQLQTSLKLHNEELTRLVNVNQENLSQLAHELKNPLTSIIGYSDLFLRQHRHKNEVKDNYTNIEHIERVLRNGRHLLRLINNVLELSRYESGQMKTKPVPTDVRELIENVYEMLEPLAREKNLQLLVMSDRSPEEVIADPLQLQQIVTNLVSNAIRYTESGTIKIMSRIVDDKNWAISVSDTGIGIAKEDQVRIFEPYFRIPGVDKSYAPNSTGLGLAIVSRLVTLMQGKIELVSQVGVGTTFTVTLPLQVEISPEG